MILFDMYGTLLDTSSVKSRINDVLDNRRAYWLWQELCMQYAFVDVITGEFHKFKDLAKVALDKVSEMFGRPANEQLQEDVLMLMKHAPLFEDVQDGLSALKDLGFPLAALSNVSAEVLRNRMESTGLISYFDFILSAEDTGIYKPGMGAYEAASKKAGQSPADILMVTSEWWDLRGAQASGLETAYLKRNSDNFEGPVAAPSFIVKDTGMLAEVLKAAFIDHKDATFQK